MRQRRGISFPRPRRSCGWLEDQRLAAEIIVEIGQRELDSLDRGGAGIGELNSEMIPADSRRRDADPRRKRLSLQSAIDWTWLGSALACQIRTTWRQPGQNSGDTEYHNSHHELRPDGPAEGARDSRSGREASGDEHRQAWARDENVEGAEAKHEQGECDLRRDAQAVRGLDERLPRAELQPRLECASQRDRDNTHECDVGKACDRLREEPRSGRAARPHNGGQHEHHARQTAEPGCDGHKVQPVGADRQRRPARHRGGVAGQTAGEEDRRHHGQHEVTREPVYAAPCEYGQANQS